MINTNRSHLGHWTIPCALALLGLAICCTGCTHKRASSTEVAETDSDALFTARLCTVINDNWPTTVRIQGSLVADEQAIIGAKVAGRIAQTNVDLGSPVSNDDPLVMLEIEEFDLRVHQAEAELAEACAAVGLKPEEDTSTIDPEKTPAVLIEKALLHEAHAALTRSRQLIKSQAISESEIDKHVALELVASARLQAALHDVEEQISLIKVRRAQLALARQSRYDAMVRAPFDGIVQFRHVAKGVYVQPGTPLVTLVRTDPVRFRGSVPERKTIAVSVDQEIQVFIEGMEEPLISRVARISPALDEESRSLQIEGDIPNPDGRFRAGLFAESKIIIDPNTTTLVLPDAAVGEFAGVHKVWLVSDGTSVQQRVTIGRHENGRTEIVDGLKEGDTVIAQFDKGRAGRIDRAPQTTSGSIAKSE